MYKEWTNYDFCVVLSGDCLFVSCGYIGVQIKISDCYLVHRGDEFTLNAQSQDSYVFELNIKAAETIDLCETLGLKLPIYDG